MYLGHRIQPGQPVAMAGGHLHFAPGHAMQVFTCHRNWLSGLNPVAEVHLAEGEPSRFQA